jgi:uncharacterized protein YndB with AHSA1/START domain
MVTTIRSGVTTYATPTDREVLITRIFDASRRIVFDAYTNPEHLQQWLLGPEGWTMPICEMDARTGGSWRYVWRKDDGTEMAMAGTIREYVPPERLVTTERWGPEWPETVNTTTFAETGGRTAVTLTILYPSKEARDAALETGMKEGMNESFIRLDKLLQTIV